MDSETSPMATPETGENADRAKERSARTLWAILGRVFLCNNKKSAEGTKKDIPEDRINPEVYQEDAVVNQKDVVVKQEDAVAQGCEPVSGLEKELTTFGRVLEMLRFKRSERPDRERPESITKRHWDTVGWENASKYDLEVYINQLRQNPAVRQYRSLYGYGAAFDRHETFVSDYLSVECVSAILNKFTLQAPTNIHNPGSECFAIANFHALLACPTFVDYVRDKTPITNIDHIVQLIVAQYLVQLKVIHLTPLLRLLVFEKNKEEDAEDFYRAFVSSYFDNTIGNAKYEQRCRCLKCGEDSVTSHDYARLVLERPQEKSKKAISTHEMVAHTAETTTVNKICKTCNHDKCERKLVYQLPKILFVSVSTSHTKKITKGIHFEKSVDFSPLEESETKKIYQLGGVIYYEKGGLESVGHYFTHVYYNNVGYIANDKFSITETGFDKTPKGAKPYFAFYFRK